MLDFREEITASDISDTAIASRNRKRNKLVFAALGPLIAWALPFFGWIDKAKTQNELNRKLLGAGGNINRSLISSPFCYVENAFGSSCSP